MDNKASNLQWYNYIETPVRTQPPVKLDEILTARLRAFLEARETRLSVGE